MYVHMHRLTFILGLILFGFQILALDLNSKPIKDFNHIELRRIQAVSFLTLL